MKSQSIAENHPLHGFAGLKKRAPAERLQREWRRLAGIYLPVAPPDSIWRYSRAPDRTEPAQGWKLHVSATILTAGRVLRAVAPFLRRENALFKAPASLSELARLNAGLEYDYTQIGKFITVYPRGDDEALRLAERLYRMTRRWSGPSIPFDARYQSDGCVYYRYGAFVVREMIDADGRPVLAMCDRDGNLIPDERRTADICPPWIANPFAAAARPREDGRSPLKHDYRVFRALSQRGKGGVYQAVDLTPARPRLCLIKEGRRHGETEWCGRDGRWRVENEAAALEALRGGGIEVPKIFSSFVLGNNFYLVTEMIAGETLHRYLKKRKRRLSVAAALRFSLQLARIMAEIHQAGWLWRDCKPDNLMVTRNFRLRPIDFEGACPFDRPDEVLWSTLSDKRAARAAGNQAEYVAAVDLFALGAIIYLLFEGELPEFENGAAPKLTRRAAPGVIARLAKTLLEPRNGHDLTARTVEWILAGCGAAAQIRKSGPDSVGAAFREIAGRRANCGKSD